MRLEVWNIYVLSFSTQEERHPGLTQEGMIFAFLLTVGHRYNSKFNDTMYLSKKGLKYKLIT